MADTKESPNTMTKVIDYYFSLSSPWTYLGSARLSEIAKRHGAVVRHKPVNLHAVFQATGGLPLSQRPPARQRYRLIELRRWREHLGVQLILEPRYFPVDATLAAHWVIAAETQGADPGGLAHAILRAVWAEDRNIADADTLAAIAQEYSYDAATIAAQADAQSTQAAFAALTQEAIDRDVFGAPTYIVDSEPFWGQDRLDFVDRGLLRV